MKITVVVCVLAVVAVLASSVSGAMLDRATGLARARLRAVASSRNPAAAKAKAAPAKGKAKAAAAGAGATPLYILAFGGNPQNTPLKGHNPLLLTGHVVVANAAMPAGKAGLGAVEMYGFNPHFAGAGALKAVQKTDWFPIQKVNKVVNAVGNFAAGVGGTVVVGKLKNGAAFTGSVTDDKDAFEKAMDLGYVICSAPAKCSTPGPNCMAAAWGKVKADVKAGQLATRKYSFPPPSAATLKRKAANGETYKRECTTWVTDSGVDQANTCMNCATYPHNIGLKVPENTGNLKHYIPKLAAMEGAECACFKGGSKQASLEACHPKQRSYLKQPASGDQEFDDGNSTPTASSSSAIAQA